MATASFGGDASLQGWGTGKQLGQSKDELTWRRQQRAPTPARARVVAASSSDRELQRRCEPAGMGHEEAACAEQSRTSMVAAACAVASPGYRRRRRRGLMGVTVLCVGGGGGCWGGRAMEGVDLGGGGAMKGGTAEPWRAAGGSAE